MKKDNNATLIDAAILFRDAIYATGLVPPAILEPGQIHRFPGRGKPKGNTAGWCKLFEDGLGGCFGDWSCGLSEHWQTKSESSMTSTELAQFQDNLSQTRAQAKTVINTKHQEATAKASDIWNQAIPAPDDHPYLIKKQIKSHGARICDGSLLIPLHHEGKLCSLQYIKPDGTKRFLSGGRTIGCSYTLGDVQDAKALCIVEGFATGVSVHEASGLPVVIAFSTGNLKAVAQLMRARFPTLPLILCADDDHHMKGNPGLTCATEAAKAVQGHLAVPSFGDDRPESASDFNDMSQHCGAQAINDILENVLAQKTPLIPSTHGLSYRCMSDIQSKPICWLWPELIARGKVSMIVGNPGLGKSQITAGMAAIVTSGGRWPVTNIPCDIGEVIFLSAEDDPADTIRPRLEAAEAVLSRIFILDAVKEQRPDGPELERSVNLKIDVHRLDNLLMEHPDISLLIIDPITAYLGNTDSHNNAEVRALLTPLSQLAAKYNIAIVCVSHLNKSNNTDVLSRISGSTAFGAAARAALLVAKDPENPNRRLLLVMKNNLGPDQVGLAFSIESVDVKDADDQTIQTSRVVWEQKAVTTTADEAMAFHDPEEQSSLGEAKAFLLEVLANGPVESNTIKTEGKRAGIAERTLRRAKDSLGIKNVKISMSSAWYWKLPEEKTLLTEIFSPKLAKTPEDGHTKMLATFDGLGHLRQDLEEKDAEVEL